MELQEFQESGFKDAVAKEAEVQEISLQDQPIQVNKSSEQSPTAVTSPQLLLHSFLKSRVHPPRPLANIWAACSLYLVIFQPLMALLLSSNKLQSHS